jgi:thiamine biosynthesis lipoprotein ApbE
MEADGVATALFVMGAEEGKEWVDRQPGIEALFIKRRPDGTFTEVTSKDFTAVTSYHRAESTSSEQHGTSTSGE